MGEWVSGLMERYRDREIEVNHRQLDKQTDRSMNGWIDS